MPLTKDQVQFLLAFTEKKVKYYDLQIELTDHLAERVEEEMEADVDLTFDSAVLKVYRGFGTYGFSKIVKQKEMQVLKLNRSLWQKEVLNFIKFPKVTFTAFLFIIIYQLAAIVRFSYFANITYAGILLTYITLQVTVYVLALKEIKRIMLLASNHFRVRSITPVMFYMLISKGYHPSPILFSFTVLLSIIFLYSTIAIYKKNRSKATVLYPDAFAKKIYSNR